MFFFFVIFVFQGVHGNPFSCHFQLHFQFDFYLFTPKMIENEIKNGLKMAEKWLPYNPYIWGSVKTLSSTIA